MAIAMTLEQYLSDHGIDYDVVIHKPTQSDLPPIFVPLPMLDRSSLLGRADLAGAHQ